MHADRLPTVERSLALALIEDRWLPALGHLLLLTLVAVLLQPVIPAEIEVAWVSAVFALVALRAGLSVYAQRRAVPPRTVVTVNRIVVTTLGLAWGVCGVIATRYAPAADVFLIVMALAGLLAGGITTLTGDRWVFLLYAIAMFGPPVAAMLQHPASPDAMEVTLIGLFLIFMIRQHWHAHAALVRRLRTEDELRNRERQLAEGQAIAHVGSWDWDVPSNRVAWSDELCRILGVSEGSPASYAGFVERIHPDDRARVEAVVAEGVAKRRATEYDWRLVRPDGTLRHVHTRSIVITDATGAIVRMVGTSLDITERKQADENQRTLLRELQASIAEVKVLRGILPICASCKRIRSDGGTWEAVESYVREHTNAEFSHGLCPDCAARDWGAAPKG
jgi:PAS domain S-box-containing protein